MKNLTKIANYRTKTEAEAAAVLLENEGIPCLIQSQEGMLYGPLSPGATIYVAPEAADDAREALGLCGDEDDESFLA